MYTIGLRISLPHHIATGMPMDRRRTLSHILRRRTRARRPRTAMFRASKLDGQPVRLSCRMASVEGYTYVLIGYEAHQEPFLYILFYPYRDCFELEEFAAFQGGVCRVRIN